MLGFGRKQKLERQARDARQNLKMEESQRALLTAATATADVAQDVTHSLKRKLDEVVKQFESTARILKDALIICNDAGVITAFNPAAERMFGIKARDTIRKPVLSLFRGRDHDVSDTTNLWTLFQNEDQDDVLGLHSTGSTFPIRVSLSLLDRVDGANAMMLLIHDLTDAENARAVVTRYQSLFETSFDGIVIVLSDGCLVAANPAVSRLFGYPVSNLMGKEITELVAEKDHARLLACAPRSGRKAPAPQHFAAEGVHSSGKRLNLVFTITQIQWEGHKAVLATVRDTTEMRRLENIVAMKRDNGIDMVCCFDPTFRLTFVNKTFAAGQGRSHAQLTGSDIRDLMTDEERDAFMTDIQTLSPGISARRSETTTLDNDGREIVLDWVDHATYDETNRVIEYQRVGRPK
jgi:PAS domain S-box-containing protein